LAESYYRGAHTPRSCQAAEPAPPVMASSKIEDLLLKELEQAKAGTHQRQKSEEKRLHAQKIQRIKDAEKLLQLRIETVENQFEGQRREVHVAPLSCLRCPYYMRHLTSPAPQCCVHAG
jgi:hypothetical protein